VTGAVGPGGAVLERNASLDNVLDTSRTSKHDHNEYKKIKEVCIIITISRDRSKFLIKFDVSSMTVLA
jgi:hypothetical protein